MCIYMWHVGLTGNICFTFRRKGADTVADKSDNVQLAVRLAFSLCLG